LLLIGDDVPADQVPWERVRYPHMQMVRTQLAERYAPATANRHLAALRGVLTEAYRLGQMGGEDYHRAMSVANVTGERLPAGRALPPGELRALFEACAQDRNHAAGARDAALLAVLYGGGLRRDEAASLDLDDYTATTGQLIVRRGKGNKDRTCYLAAGATQALDGWIACRGTELGPMFCPVRKDGLVILRRMSGEAIRFALRSRAREASVTTFSPHDLRRTFISDLLDAGADIASVQRLAGHATVATTGRYDRRGEEAKQRAALLIHVPYVEPSPT
jgi:site-specific recombinase XerD